MCPSVDASLDFAMHRREAISPSLRDTKRLLRLFLLTLRPCILQKTFPLLLPAGRPCISSGLFLSKRETNAPKELVADSIGSYFTHLSSVPPGWFPEERASRRCGYRDTSDSLL